MELLRLYGCLSDATRLRIVNLLRGGPLCVCHIQEILGEPQVKVSKHLAVLKDAGVVEARREANWMIYSLPEKRPAALTANLDCIGAADEEFFAKDNAGLAKLRSAMPDKSPACTLPSLKIKPAASGKITR
jgi:ArsR family transcriptional regulator